MRFAGEFFFRRCSCLNFYSLYDRNRRGHKLNKAHHKATFFSTFGNSINRIARHKNASTKIRKRRGRPSSQLNSPFCAKIYGMSPIPGYSNVRHQNGIYNSIHFHFYFARKKGSVKKVGNIGSSCGEWSSFSFMPSLQ